VDTTSHIYFTCVEIYIDMYINFKIVSNVDFADFSLLDYTISFGDTSISPD